MMFAHGLWTEFDIDDKLGSKTPGPTKWGDPQSVLIMEKFKEQADVCHPDNLANGTLELNTVYQAGQIAMQVQYHEFAASIEDETTSRAAGGKTAYAPCPKGEASWIVNGGQAVNGCNCGIGGIGINASASDDLKRASYIFSIWATSRGTQYDVLKKLGGTPTRKAVVELPDVQAARKRPTTMPNALTFDVVYDFGIRDPNFVLGPKIPEANEYHTDRGDRGADAASAGRPSRRKPARRSARRSTISTTSEELQLGMAVDALSGAIATRGGTSVEPGRARCARDARRGARHFLCPAPDSTSCLRAATIST